MIRWTVITVVAVILAPVPLGAAQTAADRTHTVATLQAQVDRLTALLAQKAGIPDPGLYVNADIIDLTGEFLGIGGWAFNCQASSGGDVSVMIDGVIVPNVKVYRVDRPDVQWWMISRRLCQTVPLDSGVIVGLDLRPYAVGPHTVQLRIATDTGAPPKMTPIRVVVIQRP